MDRQDGGIMMLSESPPPPPAPQPHIAPVSYNNALENDSRAIGSGNDGSNSTTPRGSMENLPPPPPDLLHSDDDESIVRAGMHSKVYPENALNYPIYDYAKNRKHFLPSMIN